MGRDPTLTPITFLYTPYAGNQSTVGPSVGRREATLFRRQAPPSSSPLSWEFNGHTVQMNWPPGDRIYGGPLGTKEYSLVQFHFHAPSENHFEDLLYPLEVHLVHQASDGTLAVVGVFFGAQDGADSPFLDALHTELPYQPGEQVMVETPDLVSFVQTAFSEGYYTFPGSLTTPPCTEGVTWISAHKVINASQAVLNGFMGVLDRNRRPVQPINSRLISYYRPPVETNRVAPLIIALCAVFVVLLMGILALVVIRYKLKTQYAEV